MLCLSLAAVSLKHKTMVELVIPIARRSLICASQRGKDRFEQAEAARHKFSSLVLAARDSRSRRQCNYPQRHTADNKTREEERGSVPSDKLEPASRRSTTRPADPSNDHHEKARLSHHSVATTTTGATYFCTEQPRQSQRISVTEFLRIVSYPIARDSWHVQGGAKLFLAARPSRQVGEVGGDLTLATPSPGRGLGWAAIGAAALRPVLSSRTAL